MAADDFFKRWAKPKTARQPDRPVSSAAADAVVQPSPEIAVPDTAPAAATKPLSLADVARLTPESDYSAFLANGVDETVKRSALKKLFSDPHFNIMDGLDTYIDDYSQPDPLPPGMLEALNHAKDLLDPLARFEQPLMELAETPLAPDEQAEAIAADEPQESVAAVLEHDSSPFVAGQIAGAAKTSDERASEVGPAISTPIDAPQPKERA